MPSFNLSPVSFHGNTLFIINRNNEPYTPMRPIVEGMGLAWSPQRTKLTANKERWGVTIIVIPTKSGEQSALCMPVRKLPAYFGTISPNRVHEDAREKVILYQNECDDVLWKYWTGQQVERKPLLDRLSTAKDPERKELTAMINAWVGVAPIHYAGARSIVNAYIGVKSVDDMTVSQVKQAIQFVHGKIFEAGQQSLPAQESPQLKERVTEALAIPESNELTELFYAIKGNLRAIETAHDKIYSLVKENIKKQPDSSVRNNIASDMRRHVINNLDTLHTQLDCVYGSIRAVMIATLV